MEAYEVYSFDGRNGYELIGILPERRKNPIRITQESIVKWGRLLLGSNEDNKNIFFKQITIGEYTGRFIRVNPCSRLIQN